MLTYIGSRYRRSVSPEVSLHAVDKQPLRNCLPSFSPTHTLSLSPQPCAHLISFFHATLRTYVYIIYIYYLKRDVQFDTDQTQSGVCLTPQRQWNAPTCTYMYIHTYVLLLRPCMTRDTDENLQFSIQYVMSVHTYNSRSYTCGLPRLSRVPIIVADRRCRQPKH